MNDLQQVVKWCIEQGLKGSGGDKLRLPMLCAASTAEDSDAIRVTMTTASIDRHGDSVIPTGADLKAFRKNPVVLWAHDYSKPPIGKISNITRTKDGVEGDVTFADTQFAQEIRGLYASGFLKAWSIGFQPKAWDVIEDAEGRFTGYKIKTWELLELSAVPVPANPEALSNAMDAGLITHKSLAKSLGVELKARSDEGSWKYCVCECGYSEEHKAGKPCDEQECPECGKALKPSDEKPEKSAEDVGVVDPAPVGKTKPAEDEVITISVTVPAVQLEGADKAEIAVLAADAASKAVRVALGVEEKAGRVLSAVNRSKMEAANEAMMAAMAAIDDILETADAEKSVEIQPEPEPEPERVGRQAEQQTELKRKLTADQAATLAGRVAEMVRSHQAETIQQAVSKAIDKRTGKVA